MSRRLSVTASMLAVSIATVFAACSTVALSATEAVSRCAVSALRFQPGPPWSEATGQHTGTIVAANLSPRRCSLDGYSMLTFLGPRHQVLPFRISHRGDQMITARPPREVLVPPGGRAYFAYNKYRCDIGAEAAARYLVIRIGAAVSSKTIRLPHYPIIDFCPGERPSTTIAVTPIVSRLRDLARTP